MVTLASLVEAVQSDVPARNDVPTSAQYRRCIADAVADVNRRVSRQKMTTLSIRSGTATYALPADFKAVIRLTLFTADSVLITENGLVPFTGAPPRDRYTIDNGRITFVPTPGYTMARDLWYAAQHVPTGDAGVEVYADMDADIEALVRLKAQALALMLQANAATREAWQYSIGDERVSKERLATEMRTQAEACEAEYREAVARRNGPTGSRSSYDV